MAQTIQIKSSTTAGNVPSSLATGELAINVADGSLFFGSATTVYDDFRFGGLETTGTTVFKGKVLFGTGGAASHDVDIIVTGSAGIRAKSTSNSNAQLILVNSQCQWTQLNKNGDKHLYLQVDDATGEFKVQSPVDITGTTVISGNTTLSGDTLIVSDLDVDGDATFNSSITSNSVSATTITGATTVLIPDNGKLKLGNAGDLEIYHNGSNSIIEDAGTGTIFYRSGTQTFQNAAASKTMATFNAANSVDLNYNNSTKFQTTNTGIDVTGEVKGDSLDIDGNSQLDGTLTVGVDDTGYDVKFYGDTASAYMLWDTSDDDLVLGGAATLKGSRRFEKSTTADKNLAQGDIIYIGAGTTTEGDLVQMTVLGTWESAKANAAISGTSMLGIALGTDPDVDGVLLKGTYTLDHDIDNSAGIPLYLSDTTAGQATATAPSSSGDIVRVIGYQLGNDDEIWFDPDKTWVELS